MHDGDLNYLLECVSYNKDSLLSFILHIYVPAGDLERPFLVPLTFLPVVLTMAVAMFEIIGKGDVNLNVGEVTCVGSGERIGLIGGITGIPGTYNYSLLVFIRPFSYIFCDI